MTGIEALILQAKLAWNGDEATAGMNEAGNQANNLSAKISSAMKKIGGAIAAAFTVDKIIDFAKQSIAAGAEVDAEMSAFEQIMGDYTDEANAKVKSIADNTGMVSTRLTPYMTSMTAKFKGLGYGIDDATSLAARGLNLAADGAAFWDMSLDESTSHLNSFINGSYEGGEAIGLFANDTQMATYAVQQGLIKSTKEWANLDEATKQATRLEYAENMYKQSGATGQAAKESEQYANVMANLNEKWRQFQAKIGKPLIQKLVIPAVEKLSSGIDILSKGIDYVTENFGKWMDKAKELVPALEAALAVYGAFKAGSAIQSIVTGFQKAKLAVSLFAASQGKAQIATALSTGALKAHEIVVGLMTGKITLAQVATAIWTKVQTGLNAALAANPIGIVIAVIAALVAAFVLAYKKCDTFRAFVDNLWATLKDKLTPVIQSVSDFFNNTLVPAFQRVGSFITGTVVPALQALGSWLKDHIIAAIQSVAGWISGTLVPTLQTWGDYIMNNIVPALQGLWNAIVARVQPILAWLSGFITGTVVPAFQMIGEKVKEILTVMAPVLTAIQMVWSTVWNNVKIVFQTIWNIIKVIVQTALEAIKAVIDTVTAVINGDWSAAWEGIKAIFGAIWNGISGIVLTVLGGISAFITNTITGLKNAWDIIWTAFGDKITTVWTAIKTIVSNAILYVYTWVMTRLTALKLFWSNAWTAIKDKVAEIWDNIKTSISEKFEAAKETVGSGVDKIKEWLSFANLVKTVETIFGNVKDKIQEKIEAARDKVKEIVDKIVGFFTGAKFEWPSIPLPHFKISPTGWVIGDLLKGTIPSLGIEWYAKAMDNAMVLDGATIFGASGGQLMGGGEKGREVVSGEDHLIELIAQAVAQNNAAMLEVLMKILNAIQAMDAGLYDQIVDALTDGVRFKIDSREFGRLVKSYA